MMKLLAAADLHCGCNRAFDHDLERPRAAVRELLRLAKVENPDVLVLAGDLFDHKQPTHEERRIVASLFADSPVPIVAITGTHDRWGPGFQDTSLNWVVPLAEKMGHCVWDQPTVKKALGAWWIAIPFNAWGPTDINLISAHLRAQVKGDSLPVIGLSHEFYARATTDSGFDPTTKKVLPSLPNIKVDYWCLGDVHVAQRIARNAWYSGSMYQTDFGERRPKGVLLVDVDLNPPRVKFLELTKPKPLIELTKIPDRWPDAYVKLSLKQAPTEKLPPCVVSVRIADAPSEIEPPDAQFLDDSPLTGLRPWLQEKKGFTPKQARYTMQLAEDLVKELAS